VELNDFNWLVMRDWENADAALFATFFTSLIGFLFVDDALRFLSYIIKRVVEYF